MTHADLFSYAIARANRDRGMAQASSAQGPDWAAQAYAAIVRIAQRQATVHVDDVLREFPERPAHFNAWGSVWMRAIKAGIIERTQETRVSEHKAKHAHRYPVYHSLKFGG